MKLFLKVLWWLLCILGIIAVVALGFAHPAIWVIATCLLFVDWVVRRRTRSLSAAKVVPIKDNAGDSDSAPPTAPPSRPPKPVPPTKTKKRRLSVKQIWLHEPVRLEKPIRTRFGSQVRLVNCMVDVDYEVTQNPDLLHFKTIPVSQPVEGINVASVNQREAFSVWSLNNESLADAVERELNRADSYLRRVMWAVYFEEEVDSALDQLISAIQTQDPELCKIYGQRAKGAQIQLVFSKDDPSAKPRVGEIIGWRHGGLLVKNADGQFRTYSDGPN